MYNGWSKVPGFQESRIEQMHGNGYWVSDGSRKMPIWTMGEDLVQELVSTTYEGFRGR